MPWKTVLVALKAHQAWKRIPLAQRKAILRAAQSSAKKHSPTVARKVRDRGPVVAKRLTSDPRVTQEAVATAERDAVAGDAASGTGRRSGRA